MKNRLDMQLVRLDKKITEGDYSDEYVSRTRKILIHALSSHYRGARNDLPPLKKKGEVRIMYREH